jgi:hypothetical protein
VEVYGGAQGGLLNLTQAGFDKLSFVSGDEIPSGSVMIAPNETREWNAIFAPLTHSDVKDDVIMRAQIEENMIESACNSDDSLTICRVWLESNSIWIDNSKRHKFGVCEIFALRSLPVEIVLSWHDGAGDVIDGRWYYCPVIGQEFDLKVAYGESYFILPVKVVNPRVVAGSRRSVYATGVAGLNEAGGFALDFDMYLSPDYVSFDRIQAREEPSDAGSHSGYFANHFWQSEWGHGIDQGAGVWHIIKGENYFMADTASITNCPKLYDGGWIGGTLTWNIPLSWKSRESDEDGEYACMSNAVIQSFRITSDGTVSIAKFYVAERGTNNVMKLDGGILR